jgi:hypothetical protein
MMTTPVSLRCSAGDYGPFRIERKSRTTTQLQSIERLRLVTLLQRVTEQGIARRRLPRLRRAKVIPPQTGATKKLGLLIVAIAMCLGLPPQGLGLEAHLQVLVIEDHDQGKSVWSAQTVAHVLTFHPSHQRHAVPTTLMSAGDAFGHGSLRLSYPRLGMILTVQRALNV